MTVFLLSALLWPLSLLPLRAIHAVGSLIGDVLWWFPTQMRINTEINLALCYPDKTGAERRALGRASFREAGKLACEIAIIWRWPQHKLESLVVEIDGWEHVQQSYDAGNGLIFLSPHVGNWEMTTSYFPPRLRLTVMYRPPRQAALEPFLVANRIRAGCGVVPTNTAGIRALYKALASGEAIGLLPDQEPRSGAGVFAPFLGVEAYTMVLLSRLVQKRRRPVLIVNMQRLPRGRGFRLNIRPVGDGVYDPDPVVSATALNAAVADIIALDPAQYMWNYKRFRRKPDGRRRYRKGSL